MKEIFRPDKNKVFLAIILCLIIYIFIETIWYYTFAKPSFSSFCIPELGGESARYTNPKSIINAFTIANDFGPCSKLQVGYMSPLVQSIIQIEKFISNLLIIIVGYVSSCFLIKILKKKK